MKREFFTTEDGSLTIHLPDWNEQYHSKHGAIAEANHVFIETGIHHFIAENKVMDFSILEIGFGTGLNAFLTCIEAEKKNLQIKYTGVEAFPVTPSEVTQLNYAELLHASEETFLKLHECSWETPSEITSLFTLIKQQKFFSEITEIEAYHLIYFDAFGARVQPELWTEEIFSLMFAALKSSGVLVTYAAKGSVRRAMQAVGFVVERLPGPSGKREMLRATKY
ncbi:tRNA (5-methylaminomethyl-2-thiouridine)(34)-methyltransferase MnmD [Cochleicola gelatinilyticus]|uniref:SAM-dependent methyltransferase n=1 Tax=Cochleicola gelatinilyticus TaxID=1763537 RepID=A0A167ER09_9FLAO|nr:tRNA (5-methylaminomethyl-2-thiouridine)(34)-methyltransferase MnmD [Cochleicola gelatinilyticus]OAB75789.1 SAM-dependent methyltransferase [Cochleicola gelatinilyticus]